MITMPSERWACTVQVETVVPSRMGTWTGSRQVPTFYLTGILTEGLAETVAREIVNPCALIPDSRIHVTVTRVERA